MMNDRFLIAIVAALLVVAGSIMSYKMFSLNFPLTASEEKTLWQMETKIRFKANGEAHKVQLWLPKNTERFVVNDEDFFSSNYGLSILKREGERQAEWSIRKTNGWQTLFHRALIEPVAIDVGMIDNSKPVVEKPVFSSIENQVVNDLLNKTNEESADQESFVLRLIDAVTQPESMDNLSVIAPIKHESILPLLVQILAQRDIAARVANGILLVDDSEGKIHSWLQVHDGSKWQLYDTETKQLVALDQAYVMWTGFDRFAVHSDGQKLDVQTTISPRDENMLEFFQLRKNEAKHWLIDYSFFSLPLTIQQNFRILITIPIGVLLLVLLRNLIGVQTFGTFLPILVALSFRETGLIAGIVLFTIIVMLGLLTRLCLDKLSLLMIPRVGSILIVVLLFMVTISLLSFKLGLDVGLSVTLFPMVILAIMIERMSILWDERGPFEVFKQGIGTITVAVLAFFIMNYSPLQHVLFVFPELILVVLGLTMLMGRYTGFKLTELFRFRAFIDSQNTAR